MYNIKVINIKYWQFIFYSKKILDYLFKVTSKWRAFLLCFIKSMVEHSCLDEGIQRMRTENRGLLWTL